MTVRPPSMAFSRPRPCKPRGLFITLWSPIWHRQDTDVIPTGCRPWKIPPIQGVNPTSLLLLEMSGKGRSSGAVDGARTRDLRRDRPAL